MPNQSHIVGRVTEVPPGARKIVEVDHRSIGVFNVNGAYYALRNSCPHQGAPLCRGHVTGMTMPAPPGQYVYGRSGEILRCPWHGWEFDLTSGKSINDPHKYLVRTYEVTVERQSGTEGCQEQPVTTVDTYPVTVEDGWIVLHV